MNPLKKIRKKAKKSRGGRESSHPPRHRLPKNSISSYYIVRGRTCPSRRCTSAQYKLPTKTYQPIASVAALTAQPLAALPPYGCGVPLAGNERPAGWQYLRHKFIGAMPSSLSLRGGRRPTWQSRSTRPNCGKAIGENAAAFPRLPRPLRGLAMTNPGTLRHGITTAIPATANGAQ